MLTTAYQVRGPVYRFVTCFFFFYEAELLVASELPSYPPYLEAVSSIRTLRTRDAVMIRAPLNVFSAGINRSACVPSYALQFDLTEPVLLLAIRWTSSATISPP